VWRAKHTLSAALFVTTLSYRASKARTIDFTTAQEYTKAKMFQFDDVDSGTPPPPTPKLASIVSRLLSLRSLSRRAKERRHSFKRVDAPSTRVAHFPFMQLPAEIILEIMKELQVEDVISLSMVRHDSLAT
jgi:hypothetical protein